MVAFEEKVVSFQKENEQTKQVFVESGSNEHLDMLLKYKGLLDKLTKKFEEFLADIIPSSNQLGDIEIKEKGIPSLLDLFASAISLVATLKRSRLSRELPQCCRLYYTQVDNLRELIYDLEAHRVKDDDLGEILSEINTL